MDNLNNNDGKAERACTTPERIRLVESIKKSIHRTIQKINPNDYKNILKGEYIYMHLCLQGEIINSEYTKVALFMGAVVFKKATQKITAVITNQASNKLVKKLQSMGKPILSVLWLQACFQEKRKVPYQDFIFQEQKANKNDKTRNTDNQLQNYKQQQILANIQPLINLYQDHIKASLLSKPEHQQKQDKRIHSITGMNIKLELDTRGEQRHRDGAKFIRFIDKKQKIDKTNENYICNIIVPHQIDISQFQEHQKRKSQIISQKMMKKRNKKPENKSQGYNSDELMPIKPINKDKDKLKQVNKTLNKQSKYKAKQKQKQGKKLKVNFSDNLGQVQQEQDHIKNILTKYTNKYNKEQQEGQSRRNQRERYQHRYSQRDKQKYQQDHEFKSGRDQGERLMKAVYEKYLKDFNKYEASVNNEKIGRDPFMDHVSSHMQQLPLKMHEDQTPCFFQSDQNHYNADQNIDNINMSVQTPTKQLDNNSKNSRCESMGTYSLKKGKANTVLSKTKNYNQNNSLNGSKQNLSTETLKLNIINPMLSQKIAKINQIRQANNLDLIQVSGDYSHGMIWVISKQSKIQAIMALVYKPKIILSWQFIDSLQKNPLQSIVVHKSSFNAQNEGELRRGMDIRKYETKCAIVNKEIQNKNIVLLDSVIGCSSLENIIRQYKGNILNISDFLFMKNKVDVVITNKKNYMKTDKDKYKVINQTDFIDSIVHFSK